MIRRLIKKVFGKPARPAASGPRIIPLGSHGIRREHINPCALKTTRALSEAGYSAFVVGGAVRDLLLGLEPKDFDVATNATPEQVRQVFRRSRLIGRRFQIVHVYCGSETIEVTTYRAAAPEKEAEREAEEDDDTRVAAADGMLLRDNVFGSQEEDAERRDFTVNALYYDPDKEEVWEWHGGVEDAKKKVLRIIGDPNQRFREDPVRMLRAARFAAKLDFHIDPATRAPIAELASMLERIPSARLFDEMMKLLLSGHAERGVRQLRAEGLHHGILPMLDTILDHPERQKFLHVALHDTDERVRHGHSASPAFMLASLLWFDMQAAWARNRSRGQSDQPALYDAMDDVLERQRDLLAFPRRFDGTIKEIWSLQPRFEQRSGARPFRLLSHPRFRAGYDFLLIRAKGGDAAQELADWWTRFPDASDSEREAMLIKPQPGESKSKRRKRGPRKTADGEAAIEVKLG
ncbi:MAG: poly(A) polymerase [Hydrogenophilales bacterium 28-61-23]|nr:MAG: poly(A) polymerase [Hydrogenophilales bacterium 28-61-23]